MGKRTTANLSGRVKTDRSDIPVKALLVKENGEWKVRGVWFAER